MSTPTAATEPAPTSDSARTRGTPWQVALEPLIVQHVIGPLIRSILDVGVESQQDLLDKLCNHPSILAHTNGVSATISDQKLRDWLKATGYSRVFERKTIYSLKPTGPETSLINSIRAGDTPARIDSDTIPLPTTPDDSVEEPVPGMPREFVEPALGDGSSLPEDERPRHTVPLR